MESERRINENFQNQKKAEDRAARYRMALEAIVAISDINSNIRNIAEKALEND